MKKIILIILALSTTSTLAQTTKPTHFEWTQDSDSLVSVQSYRYELELDNLTQSKPLVATCFGLTRPFICQAPIPNITPTSHKARIRAVEISTIKPDIGPWSDAVNFSMRDIIISKTPNKPGSLVVISK